MALGARRWPLAAGRWPLLRQPGSQSLPQNPERLAHLGLDRFHRDAQGVGDLGVFQALHATHLEDFAAPVGEILYRVAERDLDFAGRELRVRARRGGRFAAELGLAAAL